MNVNARILYTFLLFLVFSLFGSHVFAQTGQNPSVTAQILRELANIPSVPGYEHPLTDKILSELTAFHATADSLGNVIVTIGSGAPHKLIVTPVDEPGFVVSAITDDGYLRLQRIPLSGLPAVFSDLYAAQPVKIGATNDNWVDGVVPGVSIHLQVGRPDGPSPRNIENMYVDVGATSAAEARKLGIDVLSPVAIGRTIGILNGRMTAGPSVGDKFGAAALVGVLQSLDASKIKGTLTIAFVVQQWYGARGFEKIVSTTSADELIYVGRLLSGGAVPGMEGVHRAPRRELGSGILLGMPQTGGTLEDFAGDLKKLADTDHIPLETDYSSPVIPASFSNAPSFPRHWAHLGVAVSWADTPAEEIDDDDLDKLAQLLELYVQGASVKATLGEKRTAAATPGQSEPAQRRTETDVLKTLLAKYGVSGYEDAVRSEIQRLLPPWARAETDPAGNLIVKVGAPVAAQKNDRILVIAHMDETGFEVKSISSDGRLEVERAGRIEPYFYQGHSALIHSSNGDHDAIIELPNNWDEANFQWSAASERVIRIDTGARTAEEVADLGIKLGDTVTIPKEYRPLAGARLNARSLDDRVGCTALISALRTLSGPLKDRDVTFVWSTQEEIGLRGAGALAKRLAADGHEPDYVFAVDTFVSSDSPLESKRFADAELGKGFAVRALDDSNSVPRDLVEKVIRLARANQIPAQFGVTAGGNDGSEFVPYGAIDIALGWPLRYSHSPAEVIDTRDVDSLARIVAAVARSW